MNCPYCGEKTDNSDFCHKCGNRLITHTITTNYEIGDTKELETYIDKNSSKILSRRFSFPSFFLGSLYYLYRKMYLIAIIFIVLSFAYSIGIYYVPEYYKLYISLIYLIISVLFNIIIAIKFNSIYINHANKKINKIKNKYKDKSRFEVMERIKYSGSTNLFAPALAILIIGLLNVYIFYKQNDVVDNLSNAKYKVTEGFRETDAEIELNEIIFRKEVTDKLEELSKDGSNKAAEEAGRILVEEIFENTDDRTGLIKELTGDTTVLKAEFGAAMPIYAEIA